MSENIIQSDLELWDVKEAIKQITHNGLLDTIAIRNQPNFFISRYVRGVMMEAEAKIRINGMINIAIKVGQIKDPDTPASWIAWAKRNGYSTDHLDSFINKQEIGSVIDNQKETSNIEVKKNKNERNQEWQSKLECMATDLKKNGKKSLATKERLAGMLAKETGENAATIERNTRRTW